MTDQREIKELINKTIECLTNLHEKVLKAKTNYDITKLQIKIKSLNTLFYLFCELSLLENDILSLEKKRGEYDRIKNH